MFLRFSSFSTVSSAPTPMESRLAIIRIAARRAKVFFCLPFFDGSGKRIPQAVSDSPRSPDAVSHSGRLSHIFCQPIGLTCPFRLPAALRHPRRVTESAFFDAGRMMLTLIIWPVRGSVKRASLLFWLYFLFSRACDYFCARFAHISSVKEEAPGRFLSFDPVPFPGSLQTVFLPPFLH